VHHQQINLRRRVDLMDHDAPSRAGLWQTIADALTLNSQLYEDAQSTPRNHRLALTIVILAALSRALGSAVILLLNRVTLPAFLIVSFLDILSVIVSYYFWTLTIWRIGRWMRSSSPAYRSLLSPIGFAYAPQLLNFLTLIPLLGRPIELMLAAWTLLAVIVAIRQALDISTFRAAVL
jgi:hypothetical protein